MKALTDKKERADVLTAIGGTPLLVLDRVTPAGASLYAKWEGMNPGGSVKDRPARFIVEEARRRGLLEPGGVIVESTSGNFGIALAMIGAVTGHRVIIVVDPKLPPAHRKTMLAYGAEVVEVSEPDDSGGYFTARLETANRIAREIGGFRPDQHFSLMNAAAHFQETGPEILAQMQGQIDYLVVPVSTAGQLRGLSEFIRQHSPDTQIIGVDAVGSGAFGGERHAYLQSGIGLAWPPSNLALDLVDSMYKAGDAEAFATCHHLARKEGILAGASSGAVAFVGLHLLAQRAASGARVLCMLSDSGQRYLETIYDEEWLAEHGLRVDIPLSELHERSAGLRVLPSESVAADVRAAGQFAPVNDWASTRLLNQAARDMMRKKEPSSESGGPPNVSPERH